MLEEHRKIRQEVQAMLDRVKAGLDERRKRYS
jgi:hypothetical protein